MCTKKSTASSTKLWEGSKRLHSSLPQMDFQNIITTIEHNHITDIFEVEAKEV